MPGRRLLWLRIWVGLSLSALGGLVVAFAARETESAVLAALAGLVIVVVMAAPAVVLLAWLLRDRPGP